ncbi:MAG: diguanylate cyclase domain-containing protein [Oscillospiraceae bacterium]
MIGQYSIIALCTNRIHEKECYEFVGELNRCFSETNMRLFVLNTDITDDSGSFRSSGSSDIFELLSSPCIDAVVVDEGRFKSTCTTERLISESLDRGIPVAVIGEPHEGCFNIQFADNGMTEVVEHLTDHHGFTRLHMIAGTKGNYFSEKRIAVFKKVLEDRGIPFDESMVSYGDFWSDPAAAATEQLISAGELPQAIVCANDSMAIAVIDTLKMHGYRVPEDVAVTGYDGIEEIYFSDPAITTVLNSRKSFCKTLVECLPQVINGRTGTEYVPTTLLTNHSCGCCGRSEVNPAQYILDKNNNFFRYQDENIVLAEVSAKIQTCSSFEEMCYLIHESDKMYAMCCLLKRECIDSTIDPKTPLEKGFGDELFLLFDSDRIHYMNNHGEHFSPCMMPSKEIIPTLEWYLQDKRCLIFNSIYYLGVPLGYVCFHFSNNESANYMKIPQTVTSLNNAIGAFRNNRYQQYLLHRIDEMYRTDSLTKLLNRWGFMDAYSKMLNDLGNGQLAVVLCDLDGLKHINDSFGHEEGDVAIRTAAQTLKKVCPEGAVCTRFGGDEMLAVFPAEEKYSDLRERFNKALDEFNSTSGKPYKVAGSMGMIITESGERPSFEELVKRTDQLMYEDKRLRKAERR